MSEFAQRFHKGVPAVLLLGAVFPWLFMFRGQIAGTFVSMRALGDVGGAALILMGLVCFFAGSIRARLLVLAQDIDHSRASTQTRILWSYSLLYFILVVSHKLRAHALISTHAYDLGFFSNICWNTAHGHWFFSSELERNFMGVHVNWILWPLAFFYRGSGDARVLLIAQAAFVAISIPLLWVLVRDITSSFSAGMLASLLFVCSPYVNHSVSNDFHPDLWMLPCFFASILAWRRNKPVTTVVLALLAILAKEDVSVVVCAWGLTLFLKKWRWTGIVITTASLAIFLFHTRIFIPMFLDGAQQSLLFYRYAFLDQTYGNIDWVLFSKAIVHHPEKYLRLLAYVLPVAGLICFAPVFLIAPLISVFPHILSQAKTQLDLADIYSMPSQPFLFVGAAFGSMWFLKRFGIGKLGHLASALIVVAGIGLLQSPDYFKSKDIIRQHAFQQMKSLIPANASLLAQQNLFPQFDTRRFIQIFPLGKSFYGLKAAYMTNPEFVVCDRIGNALPFDEIFLAKAIASWETDPNYKKIFEQDNFIVFKRLQQEPLRWQTPQQID